MTTRCSNRALAMMAGAILTIAVLLLAGFSTASAACPAITVTNGTACAVKMYFVCPGAPAIGPISVGPGGVAVVPIPGGCTPLAVPIICGNRTPLSTGCLLNVSVAPGCCADVCYDPAACTLTYTPTPGPCACP